MEPYNFNNEFLSVQQDYENNNYPKLLLQVFPKQHGLKKELKRHMIKKFKRTGSVVDHLKACVAKSSEQYIFVLKYYWRIKIHCLIYIWL